MLTEYLAIQKVNKIIQQSGDSENQVRGVRTASWGWLLEWGPPNPANAVRGSTPYLVHKNGYIAELGSVALRHHKQLNDINGICWAFVQEAEEKVRQIQSLK